MRITFLLLAGALVTSLTACPGAKNVQCAQDSDCNLSGGGLCVAAQTGNRWCAYPDPACQSGYRFSNDDVGDNLGGTCTATPPNTATLTVMVGGNGAGHVTSTPSGIDCPGTCTATFKQSDVVMLSQTASSSVFLGWSNSCSGTAGCMVTLDASKEVGALFGVPGSNIWLSQLGSTTFAGIQSAAPFSNGDLLVGGSFGGKIALGSNTLTAANTGSGFAARLRASDGGVLWFKQYDSSKLFELRAVAVDTSGNVIVTGSFSGTAVLNAMNVTAAGSRESFVAKLSGADGSFVWAKLLNSTDGSNPSSVSVDSTGNVVAAGTFSGTIMPGSQAIDSAGTFSAYMVKYSSAGAHVWSSGLAATSNISPAGVALDASGNVVVAGNFFGSVDLGGGTVTPTNTSNSGAAFIAKYAAANGAHLFDKEYNLTGTSYASIRSLTTDGSNAIYVAGEFDSQLALTSPTLTSAGMGDIYIAKFSTAGAPTWTVGFGNSLSDTANFISTDSTGQVLFAGTFQGAVSYGGTTLTAAGNEDIVIAHLNSTNGQVLKALRLGGTGGEGANTVIADGTNVFVAGTFQGFSEFGGQALTSQASTDDGFALMMMPLN